MEGKVKIEPSSVRKAAGCQAKGAQTTASKLGPRQQWEEAGKEYRLLTDPGRG